MFIKRIYQIPDDKNEFYRQYCSCDFTKVYHPQLPGENR